MSELEELDPGQMLREYQRKGLAHAVGMGQRPALLIVDMTEGFTDAASPLGADLSAPVTAIQRLLAVCRAGGHPIFYTTVLYREPDGRDGGWFVVKVPALKLLTPDSRWVRVDARLAPQPGEPVLVKQYASAFFGTDLHARLQAAGADTLILTGATTSGCVRASAVDGLQYGYRVIVPLEAVGDRNPNAHAANLLDIAGKYGDVLPLDEVLRALAVLAGATESASP